MQQKQATIINPTGLHARPAADFVAMAKQYKSRITVGRPQQPPVNAKSIIMLMSGAFTQGEQIVITATGEDEQQAAQALGYDSTTAFITMFKKGLGQTPARYIASLTTTSR